MIYSNNLVRNLFLCTLLAACGTARVTPPATAAPTGTYTELHRPLVHFSPKEKWMNDPNGMVFFNNRYHLFYQYYPDAIVWGPMHWAHATSTDLVHWRHEPVALYPDSLGYIFSGSAVADVGNTSGFGKNGQVPLVAIFTHHDPKGEKEGRSDYQNQSIAYSLDEGKTWTKYGGNPVLKNPGIKDFRDPKVFWHEGSRKWIMTLATLDRITFYSSPDLKSWSKESVFGKEVGAHGGVWECPDLFPLTHGGETVWVLLVSINPGGPNGGSATQYFTGTFDGKTFTPYQTDTRWLDRGPDNYAGITWSNTGARKIFLGWMNNWQYADLVPTEKWRGAATIPRDLGLRKIGASYHVTSLPSPELAALEGKGKELRNFYASPHDLTGAVGQLAGATRIRLYTKQLQPFTLTLSNEGGEQVVIGYEGDENRFYIDRTRSGKTSFEKGFAARHVAPRLARTKEMDLELVIDQASVELFADGGLTTMTQTFFPNSPYTRVQIASSALFHLDSLTVHPLKGIWK